MMSDTKHSHTNRRLARSARALILLVVSAGIPGRAFAHIKWFASYDVTAAPAPISLVLSSHFIVILLGFSALIFAGFLLDRFLAKRNFLGGVPVYPEGAEILMRGGIGGFFMALFASGGVILTPELHTNADWPPWLQLGIAASMLSRETCSLGGLGILVLYCYGIGIYGVFHLIDYPMFPGLAAYLILTSCNSTRLLSWRMPIVTISICGGLMWGAIEKWAYPEWTIPLLQARPYLTLGVAPADVMIIAGFVEFSLAFYILTGLTLMRLAICGLVGIFAAAIVDFGKIDAIGHLPIIIPLVAMLLHGPNQIHLWLYDRSAGVLAEGRQGCVKFTTSLCLLFAIYYGIQSAEYGSGRISDAGVPPAKTLATPGHTIPVLGGMPPDRG